MKKLNKYKVIPITEKINHEDWKSSIYKGEIVVTASSEAEARSICETATAHGYSPVLRSLTLYSPWSKSDLTACELVEENYSFERGIISPSNLADM